MREINPKHELASKVWLCFAKPYPLLQNMFFYNFVRYYTYLLAVVLEIIYKYIKPFLM